MNLHLLRYGWPQAMVSVLSAFLLCATASAQPFEVTFDLGTRGLFTNGTATTADDTPTLTQVIATAGDPATAPVPINVADADADPFDFYIFEGATFATWNTDFSSVTEDLFITPLVRPFVAVRTTGGDFHAGFIDNSGRVFTWGNNEDNQLGHSGNNSPVTFPNQVSAISGAQQISFGANYSLAIDRFNRVYSWGSNAVVTEEGGGGGGGGGDDNPVLAGLLGRGSGPDTSPQIIASLIARNITAISAGATHAAAVTDDGELFTWGENDQGQLGTGGTVGRSVPTSVNVNNLGPTFRWATYPGAIACGDQFTIGIGQDGRLYGWGLRIYLGNWNNNNAFSSSFTVPQPRLLDTVFTDWKAVVAAPFHVIAIRGPIVGGDTPDPTDDRYAVYAWGQTAQGILGQVPLPSGSDVTAFEVALPNPAINGGGWTAIGIGGNGNSQEGSTGFSLAIDGNNRLWGWGENNQAQLNRRAIIADGNLTEFFTIEEPAQIDMVPDVEVPIYEDFFGELDGIDEDGNPIVGFTPNEFFPSFPFIGSVDTTLPIAAPAWTEVTGGSNFTLAFTEDGFLFVSGDNEEGQFGQGFVEPNDSVTLFPSSNVSPAGGFDIAANALSSPSSALPLFLEPDGSDFTGFDAVAFNNLDEPFSGDIELEVYLSLDDTFSEDDDLFIYQVERPNVTIPRSSSVDIPLAVNGDVLMDDDGNILSVVGAHNPNAPDFHPGVSFREGLQPGSYTLFVLLRAPEDTDLSDNDASDNFAGSAVTLSSFDLRPTGLTITPATSNSTYGTDDTITVSFTINNSGDGDFPTSIFNERLDYTISLVNEDNNINRTLVFRSDVQIDGANPAISSGATSATITETFTFDEDTPVGQVDLTVEVTSFPDFTDSNSENNVASETITIRGPDPAIANNGFFFPNSDDDEPVNLFTGQNVTGSTLTLRNNGEANFEETLEVQLFLSDDNQLDVSEGEQLDEEDTELAFDADGDGIIMPMTGGFELTFSATNPLLSSNFVLDFESIVIPSNTTPGDYFIIARITPPDSFDQRDEELTNNIIVRAVSISSYDLVFTGEATLRNDGSNIQSTVGVNTPVDALAFSIENIGGSTYLSTGNNGVDVYLSSDNTLNTEGDGQDTQLNNSDLTFTIDDGQLVNSATQEVTISDDTDNLFTFSGVSPGSYTLFLELVTNALDGTKELDTTNNTESFTINIAGPDLAIEPESISALNDSIFLIGDANEDTLKINSIAPTLQNTNIGVINADSKVLVEVFLLPENIDFNRDNANPVAEFIYNGALGANSEVTPNYLWNQTFTDAEELSRQRTLNGSDIAPDAISLVMAQDFPTANQPPQDSLDRPIFAGRYQLIFVVNGNGNIKESETDANNQRTVIIQFQDDRSDPSLALNFGSGALETTSWVNIQVENTRPPLAATSDDTAYRSPSLLFNNESSTLTYLIQGPLNATEREFFYRVDNNFADLEYSIFDARQFMRVGNAAVAIPGADGVNLAQGANPEDWVATSLANVMDEPILYLVEFRITGNNTLAQTGIKAFVDWDPPVPISRSLERFVPFIVNGPLDNGGTSTDPWSRTTSTAVYTSTISAGDTTELDLFIEGPASIDAPLTITGGQLQFQFWDVEINTATENYVSQAELADDVLIRTEIVTADDEDFAIQVPEGIFRVRVIHDGLTGGGTADANLGLSIATRISRGGWSTTPDNRASNSTTLQSSLIDGAGLSKLKYLVQGPTVINAPWLISGVSEFDTNPDDVRIEVFKGIVDPSVATPAERKPVVPGGGTIKTLTGFHPTYLDNLIFIEPGLHTVVYTFTQDSKSPTSFARIDLDAPGFTITGDRKIEIVAEETTLGDGDDGDPDTVDVGMHHLPIDRNRLDGNFNNGQPYTVPDDLFPGENQLINIPDTLQGQENITIETRIVGPAYVYFDLYMQESTNDAQIELNFRIDGEATNLPTRVFDEAESPAIFTNTANPAGDVDWQTYRFRIPAGTHTVTWDFSNTGPEGATPTDFVAYLDNLRVLDLIQFNPVVFKPAGFAAGNFNRWELNPETGALYDSGMNFDRPLKPDFEMLDSEFSVLPGTYTVESVDPGLSNIIQLSITSTNEGATFDATQLNNWQPANFEFWLSLDDTIDPQTDINLGAFEDVTVIANGNVVALDANLLIPSDTPEGNYNLIARFKTFDDNLPPLFGQSVEQMREHTLSDNTLIRAGFEIRRLPDLVINPRLIPANNFPYQPQDRIQIRFDISNIGRGDITSDEPFLVTVDLFSIPNTSLAPVIIDPANHGEISSFTFSLDLPEVSALNPTTSSTTIDASVTLPPAVKILIPIVDGISDGTPQDASIVRNRLSTLDSRRYYLSINVDATDAIEESSESNNAVILANETTSIGFFFISSLGVLNETLVSYGTWAQESAFATFAESQDLTGVNPPTILNANANLDNDTFTNLFEYVFSMSPLPANLAFTIPDEDDDNFRPGPTTPESINGYHFGVEEFLVPPFLEPQPYLTATFDFNFRATDFTLDLLAGNANNLPLDKDNGDNMGADFEENVILRLTPPYTNTNFENSLSGFRGLNGVPIVQSVQGGPQFYSARIKVRDVTPLDPGATAPSDVRYMQFRVNIDAPDLTGLMVENITATHFTAFLTNRVEFDLPFVDNDADTVNDLNLDTVAFYILESIDDPNFDFAFQIPADDIRYDIDNDRYFFETFTFAQGQYRYQIRMVNISGISDAALSNPLQVTF